MNSRDKFRAVVVCLTTMIVCTVVVSAAYVKVHAHQCPQVEEVSQ
jgi:Na+-transporting NADH:ubiquinone oxidoreductase subunit NqrC